MISDQNSNIYTNLKKFLEKELSNLVPYRYAYVALNKNGSKRPLIISNYPEAWVNKYQKEWLHMKDPVIKLAQQRLKSFSWRREGIIDYNNPKSIFYKSSQHNILYGHSWMVHGLSDDVGILNFNFEDKEQEDFIDKKTTYISQSLLTEVHHELTSKINPKPTKKQKLSKKQIEVLHWASKGKTYYEIGIIMGITERTVKHHMSCIKDKYEVTNSRFAIRMALEKNII